MLHSGPGDIQLPGRCGWTPPSMLYERFGDEEVDGVSRES
jgi:hypothetical protein